MSTCVATLSHEALLHITGPDSLKFLQGQTTCDTRTVDATHAVPGVCCNPQGRALFDFLLTRLADEHYALRMRRSVLAASATHLGKYIVFSKAKLAPERDDWQVFGVWGDGAAAALTTVFGTVPDGQYGAASGDGFALVQIDPQRQRFECLLAADSPWPERLADAGEARPAEEWQLQEIADGVARIEAGTQGEYVPQALNYDLTGHISFTKGCYTGQEVVARLHYRGRSKTRTYRAALPQGGTAAAGDVVVSADSGQSAGAIINCATDAHGAQVLTAASEHGVAAGLRLGSAAGPALALQALPYALPAE